jgi:hypothetical protein
MMSKEVYVVNNLQVLWLSAIHDGLGFKKTAKLYKINARDARDYC